MASYGTMTLTWDSGTVSLNSGAYKVVQYFPVVNGEMDYTSETIRVELSGTATPALGTALNAINQALWQASHYQQTKMGGRVYLNYQPEGYAASRRSEVINGEAAIDSETLNRALWGNLRGMVDIGITRNNFWEGTLTPLPLTNPNGTATTNMLRISSGNTGGGGAGTLVYSYFFAPGTAITGDMPAPMKLVYSNQDANHFCEAFRISQNVFSTPGSLAHNLEAEIGTTASGGTVTAGTAATYANGTAAIIQIPTDETVTVTWNLDSSELDYIKGNYVHIGAFVHNLPASLYVRPGVEDATGTIYADWRLMPTNRYDWDLGAIRLPSAPEMPAPLVTTKDLVVQFKNSNGGSVIVDFLSLMVSDGYRDYPLHTSGTIIDDPYIGVTYWGTAAVIPTIQPIGAPLMLVPATENRFYHLSTSYTPETLALESTFNAMRGVQAYYRPRWRSL